MKHVTQAVVAGADAAAGAELGAITVPAGEVWELLALAATLVTDANAANRQAQLIIDDGTNVVFQSDSPSNQTASTTGTYVAGSGLERQDVGVPTSTRQWALPTALILTAGFRIRVVTTAIQAGDNWGVLRATVKKLG